jgi:YegS/Rv2252/BmrU family lipid kinase
MNHIFIINPKAGKRDVTNYLLKELKRFTGEIKYTVYITSGVNDAYEYARRYCQENDQETRFYVCGGDGTLNEVINGVISHPNISVACYPSGSGNDFIKNFGKAEDFLNFGALINGEEKLVDVLKVNERYTINICNLGFDAFVADRMIKFKNKPFISGKTAYTVALISSLMANMKHHCLVKVDDEVVYDDEILLCAIANGVCYGGGYYCAPLAKVDDGLIDFCLVKTLSRIKFISMVKKYKLGKHLDDPKIMKNLIYKQCKKIEISSPKEFMYCMDGEVAKSNKISIELVKNQIKFVIPKKILDNLN